MITDILNEAALSRDIDALRERFTQTQELYREVCALLFFRYGITPTANKLYQLVRKGSMSAPAEALNKFWGDLREKSRTRIEHPDLPEALKSVAGELVATLWTNAQAAAQESLTAYRAEAQEAVFQAKAAVVVAEAERDAERLTAQSVRSELEQAGVQISTQREALAIAEETSTSLQLRLDEAKHDNAALQRQLEDARREFTVELDKLRAAAQLAEERSRSTEKRMLLDMDRERTASARLQKELDALSAASLRTADAHRQELNLLQQTLGDSRQKNGQLEGTLQAVTTSLDRARLEAKQTQIQLNESNAQTMLFRSQAEDCRRQWEETKQLLVEAQRTTVHERPRRRTLAAPKT
ncbi:DNA-binding protein [Eoetvoesiella caeni]|uniref:Plasmid replication DNA-binding protein KfrA n=1 Tax=Eoetvoesiella caeni TaxID=645616 RepID=A0A366H0V1_9BURK|nr:DNA-binding protein [Eoetvoesiella caeni]MCI2811351.1 DNA-binding protein [Eoetvoesiella caeni]NYT57250.1 DNA-binding protein [Eoetvoesiella caeni]RBP33572.1 plasmid replication DNA-binding protein KfrA [Eoetvoesiella caeni]